jgi:hypothetical protein
LCLPSDFLGLPSLNFSETSLGFDDDDDDFSLSGFNFILIPYSFFLLRIQTVLMRRWWWCRSCSYPEEPCRWVFSSLLLDVPEHGKDVEDVGGHVPMLLAMHLVHLDTVLGSEVNLELASEITCGRSEDVLPGGLWLIVCVPGMLRLLAVRLDSVLDIIILYIRNLKTNILLIYLLFSKNFTKET